jgi:AAHS family 4-hydroxybenzoate transporter-like MFS transporter
VAGSLMLWLAYFMGLVIFYALINWMPILFRDAGIEPRTATLIAALFPLGGVGAILFGWLMDRYNANLVIAAGYALTAASIYAIGQAAGHVGMLMLVVFVGGILMNTAQSSMPALAAAFYPTQGRATGVAWMLGIGRFGGIAGSFLVAELARRQFGLGAIFTVVACAGVVSTVALLVKEFTHPEDKSDTPAVQGEVLGHRACFTLHEAGTGRRSGPVFAPRHKARVPSRRPACPSPASAAPRVRIPKFCPSSAPAD